MNDYAALVEWSEENRNTWRKTYPSTNLTTKYLTRIDLGSKRNLRGERPATNRLIYDTCNFCLATAKCHVVRQVEDMRCVI